MGRVKVVAAARARSRFGAAGGLSAARPRGRVSAGCWGFPGWRRLRRRLLRPPRGRAVQVSPGGAAARSHGTPIAAWRRLPLILPLVRGGGGLPRLPPLPRGSLHGPGGKNCRRGAVARPSRA